MSQPAESPAAADPLLIREDANGVARLTMNRPAQRNALSIGLMTALQQELARLAADPNIRAIVLAGAGPAFCAGHDLKELTLARNQSDRGRDFFARTMKQCSALMQAIVACPKPVIARVHGIATAAGCQLVASCDLAVAANTAKFATPGVNIGLFCSTPMVALSRNVARKHAMEMLLTGEMISADRACEMGLVNRAVTPSELDAAVAHFADTIAAKSALTVSIGKKAFYDQLEKPLAEAYDYASEVMVTNMLARDAEEGIGAFIEKRDPKWEDR
ncbi:Enoyl-CoA hydratase/isomerase [Parvibaculum lavamentivorans DS-1]|uniref:Enoyl-CoA hydratase domain-containing protein 3, mitochondrial n=1 Tax=Parvibaculum lavamentivorans (strain DS-1 / DSM 13023 / NCIMB 13966) TaxID=402881 RepID=A7HXA9_PARL1|nr:enoyl-CoA hydratase [Parvibaculum lavamentivorans]ABS64542.1 Enoyl-CoA hydratase/isomerase [Parvibaculum lavamentivorans DS-1]